MNNTRPCASPTCCEEWIQIGRMYRDGIKLEAAMAAAYLIAKRHGTCRWAQKIVKRMQEEGWLSNTGEVQQ